MTPRETAHLALVDTGEVPEGLCQCGCGEKTRLAPVTSRKEGYVRGQPRRYVQGHSGTPGPKYIVDPDTGCWIWQKAISSVGYGCLGRKLAHRVFYEDARGTIPEGLDIDHLCRVRACVNPNHMEPVTRAENVRRGAITKVSRLQVEAIRTSTASAKEMARQFGISVRHVYHIREGKVWSS